jgi:hypothetical protein
MKKQCNFKIRFARDVERLVDQAAERRQALCNVHVMEEKLARKCHAQRPLTSSVVVPKIA